MGVVRRFGEVGAGRDRRAGEVVTRRKEVGEWEIGRCVVRGGLGVGAGPTGEGGWMGDACTGRDATL
jgi:hypothetical protein